MAYLLRPPKRQRVAPPALQTEPGPEPLWLWQSQGEAPFAPRTVEESDLPETVESDAEELPQIDLPDETKATGASGGGGADRADPQPTELPGPGATKGSPAKEVAKEFQDKAAPPSCPMSPAAAATATGSELPASAEAAKSPDKPNAEAGSAAAATAGEPAKVAPKEPEHKPEDPEEEKGNETRKGTEDLILTSPQKRKADTPAEEIETGAAPKAKAKAAAKEPATKAKAKPKAGTETKPKAKASAPVEQSKAAASGKKKKLIPLFHPKSF